MCVCATGYVGESINRIPPVVSLRVIVRIKGIIDGPNECLCESFSHHRQSETHEIVAYIN